MTDKEENNKVEIPTSVLDKLIEGIQSVQVATSKIDDLQTSLKSVEKEVQDIKNCLRGTPLGNTPGLMERVRTLESEEAKRSRVIWILVAALIGLGAEAVRRNVWPEEAKETSNANTTGSDRGVQFNGWEHSKNGAFARGFPNQHLPPPSDRGNQEAPNS